MYAVPNKPKSIPTPRQISRPMDTDEFVSVQSTPPLTPRDQKHAAPSSTPSKNDSKHLQTLNKIVSKTALTTEEINAFYEFAGIGPAAFAAKLSGIGGKRVHKHNVFAQTYVALSAINTPPAGYPFNQIVQGDNSDQRIGSQIIAKHFALRANMQWAGFTAGGATSADLLQYPCRCIVAIDKMSFIANQVWGAGATPPADALSLTITATTLNSVAPYNYMTKNNRYKILHDAVYQPNLYNQFNSSPNIAMANAHRLDLQFDLRDMPVTYFNDGSGAVLANNLIYWFIVDDNANNNVTCTITLYSDFTYTDAMTD